MATLEDLMWRNAQQQAAQLNTSPVSQFVNQAGTEAGGKIGAMAQGAVSGLMAPGNALMGNYNQLEINPLTGAVSQFDPRMINDASNLAGMVTLGAGAIPSEAGALNMGMKAYHGTPHDFDKFSMARIGTGEGAQVQGHGLFFAEHPQVADQYRKALSGPNPGHPGTLSPELRSLLQEQGYLGYDTPGQAVAGIRAHPDWETRFDVDPALAPDIRAAFDAYDADRYRGQGKTYEVDIDADPGAFLNWDTPLSQQRKDVQDSVLAAHYGDNPAAISMARASGAIDKPGSEWMRDLGAKHGSEGASAKLREQGIPGVSYLDAASRDAGAGTSNHVVFDDSLIKIMRKYGIVPGAVGASAAGLSQTNNQPKTTNPNQTKQMGV